MTKSKDLIPFTSVLEPEMLKLLRVEAANKDEKLYIVLNKAIKKALSHSDKASKT